MPVLVIENGKDSRGLVLNELAVIGRVTGLDIDLKIQGVSRIHSLVVEQDGRWWIEDLGSRNGTFVNQEAIMDRHELLPGDLIHIGRATLSFRQLDELPHGIERIVPRDPATRDVVFRCPKCKSVLRSKPLRIGSAGRCLSCQTRLIIPARSAVIAEACERAEAPAPTLEHSQLSGPLHDSEKTAVGISMPAETLDDSDVQMQTQIQTQTATLEVPPQPELAPEKSNHASDLIEWCDDGDDVAVVTPQLPTQIGECSVCQTPVLSNMAKKTCSSCDGVYHEDCWYEMEGCSTYGCQDVGCLVPKESVVEPAVVRRRQPRQKIDSRSARVPWDWMFVAAASFGLLVGPFTAGIPNALLFVVMMFGMALQRRSQFSRVAMVLGMVLCLVGTVGGWFGFQYLSQLGWISFGGRFE